MAVKSVLKELSTPSLPRERIQLSSFCSKLHEPPYCHEFYRSLVDLAWAKILYPDSHLVVATTESRLIGHIGNRDDITFISSLTVSEKMQEKGINVHGITWTIPSIVNRARGVLDSFPDLVFCLLDCVDISSSGILKKGLIQGVGKVLQEFKSVIIRWECARNLGMIEIPKVRRYFWNPYNKVQKGSFITEHDPDDGFSDDQITESEIMHEHLAYYKIMGWIYSPQGEIGGEVVLTEARHTFFREKGCRHGECRSGEDAEQIVRKYCMKNKLPEPVVYVHSGIDELTRSPVYRMIGVIGNARTPEWISADEQFARNHVWSDLKELVLPTAS